MSHCMSLTCPSTNVLSCRGPVAIAYRTRSLRICPTNRTQAERHASSSSMNASVSVARIKLSATSTATVTVFTPCSLYTRTSSDPAPRTQHHPPRPHHLHQPVVVPMSTLKSCRFQSLVTPTNFAPSSSTRPISPVVHLHQFATSDSDIRTTLGGAPWHSIHFVHCVRHAPWHGPTPDTECDVDNLELLRASLGGDRIEQQVWTPSHSCPVYHREHGYLILFCRQYLPLHHHYQDDRFTRICTRVDSCPFCWWCRGCSLALPQTHRFPIDTDRRSTACSNSIPEAYQGAQRQQLV